MLKKFQMPAAAALSIALLLLPAFYNRYPITFYDTGGYIERWFDLSVTLGRSLVYGLFMGLTAGGLSAEGGSLWGTILVQAALTVWLLCLTARCLDARFGPLGLVTAVAVLVAATGLPWYSAQIMPDILESLLVLAVYLSGVHRDRLSRVEKIGLVAVIALAAACHMAHLALGLGLITLLLLARLMTGFGTTRPGLPGAGLGLGLAGLLVVNTVLAGHAGVTPGGATFIFGRLVQDGVIQRYLDEHCPTPAYRLCDYRDRMPKTADDWIWGSGSPYAEIGGWQGGAVEMASLSRQAVLAYPVENLKLALASSVEQFGRVRLGLGLVEWHAHTIAMFRERLPGHNAAYQASRQQNKEFDFNEINAFQVPIAFGALASVVIIIWWPAVRHRYSDLAGFGGYLVIALAGNAFICGAFSNPNDRYQNRLVWLTVFFLILVMRRFRQEVIGHLHD
ncbi:MAG: hypothetical protein WCF85_09285 [Rhodospirillaceae bacterium]